ncbi:MAG: ATP-binding protein [Chloroflexi bacterium]|nr:ATP-binding protein [Chloroflexota bacterium]
MSKYLKIYSPQIENKHIQIRTLGRSTREIIAHPDAFAVIPHTLIDNAVKYSPKGGIIDVLIEDENDHIKFEVSSFGPRIKEEEHEKIFGAFYRGEAAKKQEEEGAGYGLYISQLVAKQHLGSAIYYKQESAQKPKFGHWTTFGIKIPLQPLAQTLLM